MECGCGRTADSGAAGGPGEWITEVLLRCSKTLAPLLAHRLRMRARSPLVSREIDASLFHSPRRRAGFKSKSFKYFNATCRVSAFVDAGRRCAGAAGEKRKKKVTVVYLRTSEIDFLGPFLKRHSDYAREDDVGGPCSVSALCHLHLAEPRGIHLHTAGRCARRWITCVFLIVFASSTPGSGRPPLPRRASDSTAVLDNGKTGGGERRLLKTAA